MERPKLRHSLIEDRVGLERRYGGANAIAETIFVDIAVRGWGKAKSHMKRMLNNLT